MLTEITNEAIGLTDSEPITVRANFYFSIASSVFAAWWVLGIPLGPDSPVEAG